MDGLPLAPSSAVVVPVSSVWLAPSVKSVSAFVPPWRFEKVSLVRDDGGTMEGYNITYTGTYTWADGATAVTGYRFARAVGAAGRAEALTRFSPGRYREALVRAVLPDRRK